MIQKDFDAIAKADIDFLIANNVVELKTLEYKQTLPGRTDKDKKEFLADISSFANASGGDVIYGVQEAVDANGKRTGEPDCVVALKGTTADEAKLWIENMVRTGIHPRMRINVKAISGYGEDGTGFVILVRIPRSFASPHMVTYQGTSRFYCRNSAGKYQLDVQEIRDAFLATDSQAERIRNFLRDRLGKIMADETPMPLSTAHRLVLHVIPLASFLTQRRLQLHPNHSLTVNFRPIGASGWDTRYNLDGFMTFRLGYEDRTRCDGYCQIFSDGTVEAVYADVLREQGGNKPSGNTAFIASVAYERDVIAAVESYLDGYQAVGVEAPFVVTMALLGCKGAYMFLNPRYAGRHWQPIDRDIAILPEVRVESFDEKVSAFMRPIFDAVWNACGHPHSLNYDNDGNWNPQS